MSELTGKLSAFMSAIPYLNGMGYSYRMTGNQIVKACKKHKYIILRSSTNRKYGFNAKMVGITIRVKKPNLKLKTMFVSYEPCSFQEYITYKLPTTL